MDRTPDRRMAIRLIVGAATFGAAPMRPSKAADFPSRTITIVVPFQPGGSNDIIARVVAQYMTENLKSTVIVENRPGASGTTGAMAVARSEPDGYTLLIAPVSVMAINQWLFKSLGYDPVRDFAPLTLAGAVPNVLVVNPSVHAANVRELVAYAKANPGALSFASMGVGTSGHLCGEMFKKAAGIDIVHVPYKGSAPAMNDLLGGQVQMMFDNLPTSLPHIRAGKLRALAVTSPGRHLQAPDVPTLIESGYPDVVAEAWFGFVAPVKTSISTRKFLTAAIVDALTNAAVKAQLEGLGIRVVADTSDEFESYIVSEAGKWKQVVEQSGAKLD
jgi:tripartite-type tricarboxylate transporter receptor subunit TctC